MLTICELKYTKETKRFPYKEDYELGWDVAIDSIIKDYNMKFIITNRTCAKKLSYHYRHDKFGIISITDYIAHNNLFCREAIYMELLRLKFDDINKEEYSLVLFTEDQARQILDFVERIKNKVNFIIVHCEAGISRSAGIVAALEKIYNEDNNYIFKQYHPNSFVYNTILRCYYNMKN